MSSPAVQNPPSSGQTGESKSAKKKKAKAAAAAAAGAELLDSPAPVGTPERAGSVAGNNEPSESPYIRELKKNIRNTNKKISNASKTQTLIAENKDKSIDQLIAAKIINADQKRQVDNKPALEAELARYEEQLSQIQKIDDEWRTTVASVKAETEKKLTEKYEQEKADAVAEVKSKAEGDAKKALEDGFLVLSQFLRLAAHRRAEAAESTDDQDQALEGILLSVYGGDHLAVAAMVKLYQGTEDTATSVSGDPLQTTFATVKERAAAHSAPLFPAEQAAEEGAEDEQTSTESHPVQTDPTIAHAGLTEIDAGTDTALTNGVVNQTSTEAGSEGETSIPNAGVGDSAANAAAEKQWDSVHESNDLAASQEWVEVQKPTETAQTETPQTETPQPETAPNAAPAAPAAPTSQSWADDQPEATPEAVTPADPATPADSNDGFQSVQRGRGGRGDREGGFRGGRGGGHRGRGGYRGDGHGHRGRGRGGSRGGGRGGFRREGGNEGSS